MKSSIRIVSHDTPLIMGGWLDTATLAWPLSRFDTLEQSLLHIVKDRIMLDNCQIFRLGLELLVGIHARPKHIGCLRGHSLHLLSHLASG